MGELRTAQLANEGGVNVETIRYYERRGLLPKPPRTGSVYRVFPQDAVKRLRFIKHAQALGFSLKQIRELLSLQVKPGSSCADVCRTAQAKITATCSGRGPISDCSVLHALNEGKTA